MMTLKEAQRQLAEARKRQRIQQQKDAQAMDKTLHKAYKKFNLLDISTDVTKTIVIQNMQLQRIGRHIHKDKK